MQEKSKTAVKGLIYCKIRSPTTQKQERREYKDEFCLFQCTKQYTVTVGQKINV